MANYERAFDDGCRAIAAEVGIDVSTLRRSVFEASHELWRSSRWSVECLRLGLGSPTSLLTDLLGGRPEHAPPFVSGCRATAGRRGVPGSRRRESTLRRARRWPAGW